MARLRFGKSVAVVTCFLSMAAAQDQAETCYGPGSVVGAVLGTLVLTLALLFSSYYIYKAYWRNKKGKHLVLMTDVENPNDQYAFDNPCFREATPIKRDIHDEKQTSKLEKNKWLGWTPLSFGKEKKIEPITSMDDSYVNDSRLKIVTLKGHDFTGLGFNICGNMRDGIFVKDVLHRGPAFESGCINSGDRIDSVCISFRNMVFEDALTILSYASPYDVQIQVENDSFWKPSTLLRSKRESNAVSSAERILHPKYTRSQSISHLNEIGKGNNKKTAHQIDFLQEKNRMNQSLNKNQDLHNNSNDYPTIKVSAANHTKKENQRLEKTAAYNLSPKTQSKTIESAENKGKELEFTSNDIQSGDSQNKFQKFGIKVLPINMNPKMGIQSMAGTKKSKDQIKGSPTAETENIPKDKPEKPAKPKFHHSSSRSDSPSTDVEEPDANRENVKGILTKGLQNLKEKINQNTLGKKKNKDPSKDTNVNEEDTCANKATEKISTSNIAGPEQSPVSETDCPVPKLRSSVACGVKAYEKNQQNTLQVSTSIPEEVSRAGEVARSNRKSITEPSARKSVTSLVIDSEEEDQATARDKNKKFDGSDSDGSSSRVSEEGKKPKRSKGKAPLPPPNAISPVADFRPMFPTKQSLTSKEMDEIKKESELPMEEKEIAFEPNDMEIQENIDDDNRNYLPSYDSDSDIEMRSPNKRDNPNNTKIELNATEVTIHQSSPSEGHEEDKEPSRKAASLGDLSKLDSEQPLSIVLERAVSLDLTDGSSQCGKKRKAPLPPPKEFPAVFEDYRKEPRLDGSLGVNTFQRRLKKSSDFGTLEDVLNEGPKSLEIEVNKHVTPLDLIETHNSNIQEFSSWLAECRRPKNSENSENSEGETKSKGSTSFVNISPFDPNDNKEIDVPQPEYRGNNFCFSVNGKNFPEIETNEKSSPDIQSIGNFPGANSKTVVVISQPNSLEPTILEAVPVNNTNNEKLKETSDFTEFQRRMQPAQESEMKPQIQISKGNISEKEEIPPKLPTTPVPSPTDTLSSPLSSTLTYITEIKVSTSEQGEKSDFFTSKPSGVSLEDRNSEQESPGDSDSVNNKTEFVTNIREKIEKFDGKPTLPAKIASVGKLKFPEEKESKDNYFFKTDSSPSFESSGIPIRTMKSETGQRVLATIQSLAAKESPSKKTPEAEYAKRVASILSGNEAGQKNQMNFRTSEADSLISRSNFSNGLYFKGAGTLPSKSSKDSSPTRKVPPAVPPRKNETSLSNKSTVTVELQTGSQGPESPKKDLVTFSSFVSSKDEKTEGPSQVLLKVKDHAEFNGDENKIIPTKTNVVVESNERKNV